MTEHYLHRHLTPAVAAAQFQAYGQSQAGPMAPQPDRLGAREVAFISARDSFYLASLTESGAPYIQHRGGLVGFLRVIDERTLGFADYAGNRQLLSTGHVRADPRVALFLMDYRARRRLKIDAEAEVVPLHANPVHANPAPNQATWLRPQDAEAGAVERLFRLKVVAFDWNCPQFITPRFTATEVEERERALRERIATLEQQLLERQRPARGQDQQGEELRDG